MIVYMKQGADIARSIWEKWENITLTDDPGALWDGYVLGNKDPTPHFVTGWDETAQKTGTADFLVRRGGEVIAYNTGYFALFTAAYRTNIHFGDKKAVVLGEGKMASSALYMAKELGAKEALLLPTPAGEVWDLKDHHDTQIIIRCGTGSPDAPLPLETLEVFPYLEGIMDCNPLPLGTRLLREGEKADKHTIGGLYMEVAKVAIAVGRMRDADPSPSEIGRVTKEWQTALSNVVLTGMTGSGCEEVAALLGEAMHREVIRVPALQEAVVRAGALTGKILLLDEGVAKHKEYRYRLSQNGRIYFFVRPLAQLEGNPLSGEDLDKRYRELLPGFRAFSDQTHTYSGDPRVPKAEILEDFYALPYKKEE